jgi:hypothetical protein
VSTLTETDFFLPNEVELISIAREADIPVALRQLENGRTRVVAKLGAEGCMTLEGGQPLAGTGLPRRSRWTRRAPVTPSTRVSCMPGWVAAPARGAALGRGLRRSFHPRPGRHLPPGRCRRGRAADRVRLVITVGGFNTSVDKTLELDVLQPGAVHRVSRVQSWPGGKGLHVALTVAGAGGARPPRRPHRLPPTSASSNRRSARAASPSRAWTRRARCARASPCAISRGADHRDPGARPARGHGHARGAVRPLPGPCARVGRGRPLRQHAAGLPRRRLRRAGGVAARHRHPLPRGCERRTAAAARSRPARSW